MPIDFGPDRRVKCLLLPAKVNLSKPKNLSEYINGFRPVGSTQKVVSLNKNPSMLVASYIK